jgi:hypothetical protein
VEVGRILRRKEKNGLLQGRRGRKESYLCCSGEREAVASLNSFGVGRGSNMSGIFKWSLF